MEAINTLTLPVVQYSCNTINWNITELELLEGETRKLLISIKMHHPKADVERLHISRNYGGRGMLASQNVSGLTFIKTVLTINADYAIYLPKQSTISSQDVLS